MFYKYNIMSLLVTYTSTLPENLMKWVNTIAKKHKTTKKHIIIEALLNYRQQINKAELAKTFKKAATDKEIIAMAEEGLQDYIDQL